MSKISPKQKPNDQRHCDCAAGYISTDVAGQLFGGLQSAVQPALTISAVGPPAAKVIGKCLRLEKL